MFLFLGKKIFTFVKAGYVLFRDFYLFWNIALGAHPSRRNISQPLRLHTYVCNPTLLDHRSLAELCTFAKSMVSSDVDLETFRKMISAYQTVIIMRERLDGSLRGICFLGRDEMEHEGKKTIAIKMGLTLFDKNYQGGPYMYYVVAYKIMKELILHPWTPIHIMGKAFSYKTYVTLQNYYYEAYPVYNKDIPELERALLNNFVETVRFPNEKYNPQTFVLERELSHIKSHAAEITEEDLENPHIKFFAEHNPGWAKGHCMFFIGVVYWSVVINTFKKAISRTIRGRKGDKLAHKKNFQKFRRQFDRHFSFYGSEAKEKVLDNYIINHGRAVLKKDTSADIYVFEESNESSKDGDKE